MTDEDRREVAERLRELDVDITSRGTLERAVDKLMKAVYGEQPFSPVRYSVRNLCGLGQVIADLIDPTCNAVPMDAMGKPPYYTGSLSLDSVVQGCSRCGYPFGNSHRGIGNPRGVPNYCPNCGARVA